jgi:catechol 2,3-dioxygenase-like lactoylglutathione lyase family enzyme
VTDAISPIGQINAVTLFTVDMARSVAFYRAIGFRLRFGGPDADFSTFEVGGGYLNLAHDPSWRRPERLWGRVIFWVDDVDEQYRRVRAAGWPTSTQPADAPWGERYFHVSDPDGHELSFARPLG